MAVYKVPARERDRRHTSDHSGEPAVLGAGRLESAAAGLPDRDIQSVVGAGNDNWGYVFPFFASNLLANIYGYIQNKKTTFKSDAPAWCFAVYLALMVCLILFSTWLQGVIANALRSTGAELWSALAPTLAAAAAGTFQMAVLFPVEKFVLLKEKKE